MYTPILENRSVQHPVLWTTITSFLPIYSGLFKSSATPLRRPILSINYNTAGKVTYFMPILEEIEIYFTDEWGDRIVDYIDFQMVLTFDFAPPEPLPEPNTIKRARRELNL